MPDTREAKDASDRRHHQEPHQDTPLHDYEAPLDTGVPVQPIGKSLIEVDLYRDWHCQQRDDNRMMRIC
jgi:hypothetical protein